MTTKSDTEPAVCLPPRAPVTRPRVRLPEGATDCHCHVYDDPRRYPLVPERSYTPVSATLDDYLAMCRQMGITRTVQVSASVYGADNRLTLDTIAALGQDRARGVAGLHPDITAAELALLHDGGMRGVRVSTHVKGYGGTQAISHFAQRIRPLGWHVQVHVASADEIADLEDELLNIPVPIVFDHLGCVRGAEGPGNRGFQAMLRLLRRRDDCWAKISSWYRRSDAGKGVADAQAGGAGRGSHADMAPIVAAMVDARPDRLVFGTNWPHPALHAPQTVPDDAALVDEFVSWIPDDAIRQAVLVDNPARLYGFPR